MEVIAMSKRKDDYEEVDIQYDGAGNEIHVFDGPLGKAFVKKLSSIDWLPTGEEYCPDCHKLLTHRDGYWECDICKYSITDDEAENGDGYPTLDSTYEDDYGTYYEDDSCTDDEDDDELECDSGYEDYDYHEEY